MSDGEWSKNKWQFFWSRFWREYVPTLRKVTSWVRGEDEPEVGQMVLVLDKEFEGQVKWPLARITGLKRDCAGKVQTGDSVQRSFNDSRDTGTCSFTMMNECVWEVWVLVWGIWDSLNLSFGVGWILFSPLWTLNLPSGEKGSVCAFCKKIGSSHSLLWTFN